MNKDLKNKYPALLTLLITLLIISFIYAGILMWLWNLVIVPVFCAPIITYWQAYAIYIICNILFGSKGTKLND